MNAVETLVRERPILFSGAMVRAILDGTKTQTRRVVKFPRAIADIEGGDVLTTLDRMQEGYKGGPRPVFDFDGEPNSFSVRNPYGAVGDRLWVRETWTILEVFNAGDDDGAALVNYAADEAEIRHACGLEESEKASDWLERAFAGESDCVWRPSIHIPRWASRLSLEITGVRVERLQAITADDCIAEGIPSRGIDRDGPCIASAMMYIDDYQKLWDSINAKRGYGWDVNPWVWVVEFKRPLLPESQV